ncbi:uncharacterized protein LOC113155738 [Anabas testudineus]|uniref:uncharacterized protein LOC113155738 n=1 Tax=Anabas testudineus TaxID=64144 RepID=UPI00143CC97B|nr:uncharacterized protein LOC113155738 [Anabas testudineus]
MCGILLLLNLVSISTHGHHQITAHIMDNVTLLFQSSGVPVYGVFLKILGHDKYIYSCRDGRHVDANQQEPRPGGWVVQEEKYICGNRSIEEVSVGLPNVTIYDTNTYEWWVQEGKEEAFKKFFTVSMIIKSRDVTTIHPRAGLSTAERTTAEETTAENATTGYATAENVTAGNATNVVLIMLAVVVVVVVILLKLCGKFNPKSDLSVTYTECVQEQI